MGYTKTQQARLLAGVCFSCGAGCEGEGSTKHRCVVCAEKGRAARRLARRRRDTTKQQADSAANREARRKRNTARQASGICLICHRERRGREATPLVCGFCAKKERARSAVYQQKKRNKAAGYKEGDGRNVKKWPMGAASTGKREGGAWDFMLTLDIPTRDAILAIRQQYRDAETRAGREPQTHQISRLVREVIVRYEPHRVLATPRKPRLFLEMKAHLSLDGRCKAVLTRQAETNFDGNKSAALRAMIIECQGPRRAFTGRPYRGRML